MSEAPPGPVHSHCQNCGEPLRGPYCHACGQRDFELHASVRHLAEEALESFLHFDARWFRALHDLLFRPGFLSVEFNAGRRARHVPPLRFYLFTSFVFFLIAALTPERNPIGRTGQVQLSQGKVHFSMPEKVRPQALVEVGHPENLPPWARGLVAKLAAPEHAAHFRESFQHHLPKALFVCVPLLALLTMGLFRTPDMFFINHLVVSLHLHTAYFLLKLCGDGWTALAELWSPWLAFAVSMAFTVYFIWFLYATLRRVYGRPRGVTIRRGLVVYGSYGLGLLAVLLSTVAVTLLLA